MLINFVDANNDANHYTKPPPWYGYGYRSGRKIKIRMAAQPYTQGQ